MDSANRIVNADANIFGLCDKQLACTTCRVDIEHKFDLLAPPSEEELDVLYNTKNYNENKSRMACQIVLNESLDGMVVRILTQKQINY
jgi:2Fe-2S ferredoxin